MSENKSPKYKNVLNRQISLSLAIPIVIFAAAGAAFVPYVYLREAVRVREIVVPDGKGHNSEFVYGSWPALENASFFENVKQRFIAEKANFIEADLTAMKLKVYRDGSVAKEVPIVSKGKTGSWWETPAGLYKIEGKEKTHYSSFGHVYMPWSMPFQGNFFIHGWPYYEGGKQVAEGYSGGCIRLSTEDAKSVFELSDVNMPVLVFEQSFRPEGADNARYEVRRPGISAASYLAADLESNFVFMEKNPELKRPAASLSKLMTALVAVEYINVERKATISSSMLVPTEVPRLKSGDSFTVLDLLSLLLMESSNEAARAIVSPIGRERFQKLMNVKAEAIGMKDSVFTDAAGIDSDNVSTAEDLFMLAKYLYHNRSFVLNMSVGNENRAAYGPSVFKNVKNFNRIPGIDGIVGAKNDVSGGETNTFAVIQADISGEKRPIVVTVLGSKDSEADVMAITQYIEANFERSRISAEL